MTDATQVYDSDAQPIGAHRVRRRCRIAFGVGGCVAGVVAILACSAVGIWFSPFICAAVVAAAGARRKARVRVLLAIGAVVAVGGWGIALLWRLAMGEPVGSVALTTAALSGLPATAGWLIVVATLLLAAVQGLCGAWLGSAVINARLGLSTRHDAAVEHRHGEQRGYDQ